MADRGHLRVSIDRIPNYPVPCDYALCELIHAHRTCPNPRDNKGDRRAICHGMSNRELLKNLQQSAALAQIIAKGGAR